MSDWNCFGHTLQVTQLSIIEVPRPLSHGCAFISFLPLLIWKKPDQSGPRVALACAAWEVSVSFLTVCHSLSPLF